MKRKHSTPKMGIPTRNKMYKYPSVPAMGKAGGKGTTLPFFATIGSAGQRLADQDKANVKFASDRMERPGQHRTGKGSYAWNSKEDKIRGETIANNQVKGINSIFNSNQSLSMADRMNNVSVPAMGPGGAMIGGYLGKKLGSWVGSAGKLIGKKHEKYGRQAGEYIGGTLGAGIGLAGVPF